MRLLKLNIFIKDNLIHFYNFINLTYIKNFYQKETIK